MTSRERLFFTKIKLTADGRLRFKIGKDWFYTSFDALTNRDITTDLLSELKEL